MGVSEGVLAVRGRLADDNDDKGMMARACRQQHYRRVLTSIVRLARIVRLQCLGHGVYPAVSFTMCITNRPFHLCDILDVYLTKTEHLSHA
jgi:hypothetical protein